MFTDKPADNPMVASVGCAFAAIAGFVDVVGYLTLRQIYVANMSGNTVAVAAHLASRQWLATFAHACPLLAFVPGLMFGDAAVELARRARYRAALNPALAAEIVSLGAFVVLADVWISPHGDVHHYAGVDYVVPVALLAFAMGVQNGAVRRTGALKDVHTYVTGTLLATAHGLTNYGFWLAGRLKRPDRQRLTRILRYSPRQTSLRDAGLAASLWTLYLSGAVGGAFARNALGVNVLFAPIVVLVLIAGAIAVGSVRTVEST